MNKQFMELTRNNYEEYFLLYVDKELDYTGRAAVEQFVAQNPDLQKELYDLQEAVLIPETIVFKQKDGLYRHEETKIVAFPWRVVAAAAVLIVLGTATWLFVATPSQNKDVNAVAQHGVNNQQPAAKSVTDHRNTAIQPGKTDRDAGVSAPLASKGKPNTKTKLTAPSTQDAVSSSKSYTAGKPSKNEPVKEDQELVAALKPVADERLVAAADAGVQAGNAHVSIPVAARELEASPQTAENKGEIYATDPPRDNVVYIANLAVKKSSFREAFRKASRIFDKVTTLNAPTPKEDEVAMLKQ